MMGHFVHYFILSILPYQWCHSTYELSKLETSHIDLYFQEAALDLLLDSGADLTSRDCCNNTALHHACLRQQKTTALQLLEKASEADEGKQLFSFVNAANDDQALLPPRTRSVTQPSAAVPQSTLKLPDPGWDCCGRRHHHRCAAIITPRITALVINMFITC